MPQSQPQKQQQQSRRPIRIGNISGAIGDGIDQIYELVRRGAVDALTADYLAEFNLAWKAIELQTRPDLGYETGFLDQLAWPGNGEAARLVAKHKVKIVHDGGALNPEGLALATDAYFKSLGIHDVKIAWVAGDNVTEQVRKGEFGAVVHLDKPGVVLEDADVQTMLTANAYTGQAGIVRALEEGADVVICGRCCDASPVMGLAYWWHGWKDDDYDMMAGSLMAGHLIECGPYVAGGNYCGADEIESLHSIGFPIAEIASDGTAVITKPEGTNGAVTIDTCKAQLLYEIQGPIYLNLDVIADIEHVQLTQAGRDRVKLSGVKGLPPPPTAKLAVCLLGGYQAELSGYAAGLNTEFKFRQMKDGILRRINPDDFTTISIEKYGLPQPDPQSQKDATVQFRIFAQAENKESMIQLKRAIFFNGLQGYCGLHLAMDWRTLEPRPYVKYFPALISQSRIPMSVQFVKDGSKTQRIDVAPRQTSNCIAAVPSQRSFEPKGWIPGGLTTVKRPLGDLVFARSGDKGGNANVGFWVRDEAAYSWLQAFLTSNKLIELLGNDWSPWYTVERCEFPNLWAVHFVVKGILQEGVSSSSIIDGFAKSFGEFLRARVIDLPRDFASKEDQRRSTARSKAGRARL